MSLPVKNALALAGIVAFYGAAAAWVTDLPSIGLLWAIGWLH